MVNAFKDYLNKSIVFKGRTSRKDFWLAIVGVFIFIIVFSFVFGLIGGLFDGVTGSIIMEIPIFIVLSTVIPTVALYVRRLHDINKSGWLVLIGLIPFIGYIILLVLFCFPSVNEGNTY